MDDQISAEELGVLYRASTIELRMAKARLHAMEEQLAVTGVLMAQAAELLGVAAPDQILPAIAELKGESFPPGNEGDTSQEEA